MNAINHRKCVTDEGLKNVCANMDTEEIFGDVPVKNLCFFFRNVEMVMLRERD